MCPNRLLQHGLLPREEAEELVGSLKAGKCGPVPPVSCYGCCSVYSQAALSLPTLRLIASLTQSAQQEARMVHGCLCSWRYTLH